MNYTENYQLNQWEETDRVLMEDFNADNKKVDMALGELGKDVQQSLQKLEEKAGYRLITSQSLTATAQGNAVFSLSDVDWSQWGTVQMLLTPNLLSTTYPKVYINNSLNCQLTSSLRSLIQVMLYPLFTPGFYICGWMFSQDQQQQFLFGEKFSTIENITVRSDYPILGAGSKLEVWGLR